MCRRQKNNPLFVGDAGVGKTALAEGLAKRIVEKDVPDIIKDAVISVSYTHLRAHETLPYSVCPLMH